MPCETSSMYDADSRPSIRRQEHSRSAMIMFMITGHLIRQARRRSGLTQAALAARVETTQSAVARWETGGATPSLETLQRIIEACGFELRYGIGERDPGEWSLAQRNLTLTPEQRLDQLVRAVAFARAGRERMAVRAAAPTAGVPARGGDPTEVNSPRGSRPSR